MNKKTILIVDDESVNIDILLELLGDTYECEVAGDGPSALEQLARSRPDLILLDVNMPGPSGLDVCRLIKADPDTRDIPIIFITVRDELEDELEGFQLGAADYVHKPFNPQLVQARVKTHLALADQRLALEDQVRERTAELSRALERAREADKAKSAFLNNMSHELRTPLNGIMGTTSILLEAKLPQEHIDILKMAHDAAKRLLTILESILELASVRATTESFPHEPFSLAHSLVPQIEDMGGMKGDSKVEFTWALSKDIPDEVTGSLPRIIQLLKLLVENGFRFTREGEVSVEIGPANDCLVPVISEQRGDTAVLFTVRDSGPGIPEELQPVIFDGFTVGEPVMTKRFAGAGLGLALAKALTEKMGGRIWVRSRAGEGSAFHVALPLGTIAEQ